MLAVATVAAVALAGLWASENRLFGLQGGWSSLPSGDPVRFFAGGVSARKLKVGPETRNAIPARGDVLEASLVPRPASLLEVAFALPCPQEKECRGARRFTVTATNPRGQRTVLLDRVLRAPSEDWQVERIDLSAWAGERIFLVFADGEAGAHAPVSEPAPLPVWGEPILPAAPAAGERVPPWNVLLISVDTLRADRLGSYGYERRPTSPALDAFAADAVRFERAISQAPWTTPSHASLLTSLYPSAHRLNESWKDFLAGQKGRRTNRVLAPGVPTLAGALRKAGYHSFALTGGSTLAGELGFARGFDVYRESSERLSEEVKSRLVDWLRFYGPSERLFLFFHTFEVHAPYTHPELADMLSQEQREAVARQQLETQRAYLTEQGLMRPEVTSALYDGGIRFTDAFLGQLFDTLRDLGLYERTLILVTSDHGEEFTDHVPGHFYNSHCNTLFEELVHVPLLLRAPGRFPPGRIVGELAELVDITPTVLELLGLRAPPGLQGRSLVAAMDGGSAPGESVAWSEAVCHGLEWKALRTPAHTYIAAFHTGGTERSGIPGPREWEMLFNRERDPLEQRDRARAEAARSRQLGARLEARFRALAESRRAATAPRGLRDDTLERLRALGYLASGP